MFLRRRELLPGVFLNTLQTDKFKSDCLSVNLLTQLSRETISKNALLPRVLLRGSAFHPDMDAINAACDELYGATVLPTVRKMGEILSIGLYAGFIADRFTPDGAALLEPTTDTVNYNDGTTGEVYGFDIPVPVIGEEFDCALLGKKGKWYDHKVMVSNPVPVEAE